MTTAEVLVLGPLWLICVILGLIKLHAIVRRIDQAKVVDDGGDIRDFTQEEREAIAWSLGHDRGKYFWRLIIAGVALVTLVWVGLRLLEVLPAE